MSVNDDYDSPWKDILDRYFRDFLRFFFPAVHQDIDWSKGYESLDSELQKVVRDAELGRRWADKLMKVWRRNGEEQIVLIHIEVQGQYEAQFSERLYVYNYRLFDRYKHPVVSLVVLADEQPNWRPERYQQSLWGYHCEMRFPLVKLSDYTEQWDALEHSANPFALVVITHLQTQATRKNPSRRYEWKLRLTKRLYERGYERQDVLELFRFIDWLLRLPEDLEQQFEQALAEYEATMSNPYITSIERHGIEKGFQQGRAEGIEQGIEKGIEKGLEKGREWGHRDSLFMILQARFGELPVLVKEQVGMIKSRSQLEHLLKSAATVDSLASFEAELMRQQRNFDQ